MILLVNKKGWGNGFRKIAVCSILFLALLAACERHTDKQKVSSSGYGLSAEELSSLQSGDIIFRMGYGGLSLSIVSILSDTIKVSHCGIVAKDSTGIAVIHTISPSISEADGMQQCTIEEFIADSRRNSIAAVRFKHGKGQKIVEKAVYYLNKQVPFDMAFNLVDSSKFFCSELPIRILKDEFNFDLLQGKEPVMSSCKFSVFFNPQHFETIIYHLSR